MLLSVSQLSYANTAEQEINHLIDFVAQSDAIFIRNGTEHSSKDAAEHLGDEIQKSKLR